jgi:hypothetical protein
MQNPSEMPEAPKLSHTQVKYGMAKPGGDKCATCGHYVAKNNCMIVEPPIYPAGWCTRYESKAMEAAESEREVRPPVYADRRHQSNNSSDERPPPSTAAGAMNTEALSHGRAIAGAKALHAVGHITAAERDKHVKASQRFISKRKAFGSWAP